MSGGSLGGIMAMLMGTVEPHVKAIAPIVGAGGLGLVSRRSLNQNVRNAILARAMGPFYVVSPIEAEGEAGGEAEGEDDGGDEGASGFKLEALLPDLTERPKRVFLATLDQAKPGDTLVAHNLKTGERRCGVLNACLLYTSPSPRD